MKVELNEKVAGGDIYCLQNLNNVNFCSTVLISIISTILFYVVPSARPPSFVYILHNVYSYTVEQGIIME